MTPETRQRYVKAIAALVGILPTSEAVPLDEAAFCRDNAVKPSFFLALRDLDCLVLMPSADEVTRYRRTDKLMRIEPERIVAQMKASGRPKTEAPTISGNVKVEFFNPADNVPAEESPKQDEEAPKLASSSMVDYLAAVALDEVPPIKPNSELVGVFGTPGPGFTTTVEQAEKAYAGCTKGPATYPDLSETKGIDPLLIFGKPDTAEQPVPPCGYTPRPKVPMLERDDDVVQYCVDVIGAHGGDHAETLEHLLVNVINGVCFKMRHLAIGLNASAKAMQATANQFEEIANRYAHD